MRLIYMAHPYGRKPHNLIKSVELEEKLASNVGVVVFNPVRYFATYDGNFPEDYILSMCLGVLGKCDELWLADGWQVSVGCCKERAEALRLGMTIREINGEDWF